MFEQEFESGQKALFGVLKCLSLLNPEVGYVQGMGFLTAVMMTYMSPEESLCMMMALFKDYQLLSIFQPGLPGLEECIYVHNALLKKYVCVSRLPRASGNCISASILSAFVIILQN